MNESSRVADALARDEIPWRFPAGIARNLRTGMPYCGVRPMLLNIVAGAFDWTSPWFGTLKDHTAVGNTVKPELGVRIPGSPDAVYNLDQTNRAYEPPSMPIEDPAKVFDAIVNRLGVKVEHGIDSTCKYFGADDRIRIPHRWMFEIGPGGMSGYYDALGHELMHATEARLRWDGHPDVAELRAEIGSGNLCGLLGVKPLALQLRRHHDAHLSRWLRLMRADPKLLLAVTKSATEAVSFLLRCAGREVGWHDAGLEKFPCSGESVP